MKISWTERVRNYEVLGIVGEEHGVLGKLERWEADMIINTISDSLFWMLLLILKYNLLINDSSDTSKKADMMAHQMRFSTLLEEF